MDSAFKKTLAWQVKCCSIQLDNERVYMALALESEGPPAEGITAFMCSEDPGVSPGFFYALKW